MSQTGNYNLENVVQQRETMIEKLGLALENVKEEKASGDKMVEILKNELKL